MVDESQIEAVVGAITYTSAPLEQVILWTQGPDEAEVFHTKLRNDLSSVGVDVWLQIENRLGLDVEQAVTLSHAMGDGSGVGVAPVITSVKAERFELDPGASIAISCAAADLSGGELTYQWRAVSGTIDDEDQATARWTAPDAAGLYAVTVVVSDERGNHSEKSVNLRVGSETPPPSAGPAGPFRIEEITAERDPSGRSAIAIPLGADWRTVQMKVFIGSTIRVTCVMDGAAEGLTYEWNADAGDFVGSGDSVVWVAPGHEGLAQVSLIVRDDSGNEDRATIHFRSSTCSQCFSW